MTQEYSNELYSSVRKQLAEGRLKEAFGKLSEGIDRAQYGAPLRPLLERTQETYRFMLQYMSEGADDPHRERILSQIKQTLQQLNDRLQLRFYDETRNYRVHIARRDIHQHQPESVIAKCAQTMEAFYQIAIDRTQKDSQPENPDLLKQLKEHDFALSILFLQIWINEAWNTDDIEQMHRILRSEQITQSDRSLTVSAVTVSLLLIYDEAKFNWLLEAAEHTNIQVRIRAIVGIWFVNIFYNNRILESAPLKEHLKFLCEDTSFRETITLIQLQMIQSFEAEKVNRQMRDEILPELIKGAQSLSQKIQSEETDEEETDFNPEWLLGNENSKFYQHFQKMNDWQEDGADINFSTFQSAKNFQFFDDISGWFYPFTHLQAKVYPILKQNENNPVLNASLLSPFMCDSDKYSFCLIMSQLPSDKQDLSQSSFMKEKGFSLNNMMDSELFDRINKETDKPQNIVRNYLFDCYRFFNISVHQEGLHNPFATKTPFDGSHGFFDSFLFLPEQIGVIIGFSLRKQRYSDCLTLFKKQNQQSTAHSLSSDQQAEMHQKWGYCLQKLGQVADAINHYIQADILRPNQLWTLKHLATTYRLNGQFSEAALFYQKVLEVEPDNLQMTYLRCICLTRTHTPAAIEEAHKGFFKLDYHQPDQLRYWRGIGWTSLLLNKLEQAERYFNKIIQSKQAEIEDFINAGHCAWAEKKTEQAIRYFRQANRLANTHDDFCTLMKRDKDHLQSVGAPLYNDIDLILLCDLALNP